MDKVKDIPLYDRTKVNTTNVLLQHVNRNYKAGLSKHDTAGVQTCLELKLSYFYIVQEALSGISYGQTVSSEKNKKPEFIFVEKHISLTSKSPAVAYFI
jgi:hypothetical protein